MATVRVLLFKVGCGGWPLRRAKRVEAREGLAVHTQGNARKALHTTLYVATAGVLLFKGSAGAGPCVG